jgi:hypothetical protein
MHPKSESAWEHLACAIQAYHGFFKKGRRFQAIHVISAISQGLRSSMA